MSWVDVMSAVPTALYRHFNKSGELLYVGISLNTLNRLGQHKKNAHWFSTISNVTIEHYVTREEALQAETKAIQSENPAHNIRKTVKPYYQNKSEFERLEELTEIEHWENTKAEVLHKVSTLEAVYTSQEIANKLEITHKQLRECIKKDLLSAVLTKGYIDKNGVDRRKWIITGWSYIDFLEFLEKTAIAPWHPDFKLTLADFSY